MSSSATVAYLGTVVATLATWAGVGRRAGLFVSRKSESLPHLVLSFFYGDMIVDFTHAIQRNHDEHVMKIGRDPHLSAWKIENMISFRGLGAQVVFECFRRRPGTDSV